MPHIVSTDQPIYFTCIYDGEVYLSELSPIGQAVAAPHELISDASENAYLGKLPADKFPALPVSGWLEQGAIYAYSGALVMVRQSHNRTIYEPSETPALFVVYREDAAGVLEWVANEPVVVGIRRTYDGVLYECIQSHTTQTDWQPDRTPALWRELITAPQTGAWAVGVSYKIGDRVIYNGATYECIQAHTSQAGWTPAAVPALWRKL